MSAQIPPARRRREHSTRLTTATHGTSTTVLKKKIRDLTRLLSNPRTALPADVRLENERALEAFKHELSLAQSASREQKIAKKYHMVRFFGMLLSSISLFWRLMRKQSAKRRRAN
jgi:rRNA-processing protein Efg1